MTTSIRRAIAICSAMLALILGSSIARAQQQTAAEWARRIAFTISQNPGAATSDNPIMSLVSAISHDNVVEVKYVMKDAAAFARLKQNAEQLRLGKTSYFCNASRIPYLTLGVVIREITTSPGGDDQIEIVVDRSSCDSLPKISRLDPVSLAKLALSVAKAENDSSAKNYPPNDILRFDGANAHEGVVEEKLTLPNSSPTSEQITNLTNVSRGIFCAKYGTPMRQGITFHETYVSKAGNLIFDFGIDGSHC